MLTLQTFSYVLLQALSSHAEAYGARKEHNGSGTVFKMGLRPKPRAGLPPPAASVRPVVGFDLVGFDLVGFGWLVWTAVLDSRFCWMVLVN